MRQLTTVLLLSSLWAGLLAVAGAATPEPSATSVVTGTPGVSGTPTPEPSQSPSATSTPADATATPEASPSSAPANFALSGRLVVDANSSAVADPADEAPHIAFLNLVPWSTADRVLAPTPVALPTVRLYSAPDGSFAFESLPVDSYTLELYWPFGFETKGASPAVPTILRAAFRVTEKGEIVAPDPLPKYWPGSLEPFVPDEPILGPIPDPVLLKKIDDPGIALVPVFTTGSAGPPPVGSVDVAATLRRQQSAAQLPPTGVPGGAGNAWQTYLPLALAAVMLFGLAAILVRRARA